MEVIGVGDLSPSDRDTPVQPREGTVTLSQAKSSDTKPEPTETETGKVKRSPEVDKASVEGVKEESSLEGEGDSSGGVAQSESWVVVPKDTVAEDPPTQPPVRQAWSDDPASKEPTPLSSDDKPVDGVEGAPSDDSKPASGVEEASSIQVEDIEEEETKVPAVSKVDPPITEDVFSTPTAPSPNVSHLASLKKFHPPFSLF